MHPVWWLSLLVLLLNDHLLKGAHLLSPAVTGKLSDFAGMLVAPALLAVLVRARRPKAFVACHFAVGCVFTLLELSDRAAAAFCEIAAAFGLAYQVVADPTDLVALPMLALSVWLFHPLRPRDALPTLWRRAFVGAAKVIGFASIVATSQPPPRTPILTSDAVYVSEYDRHRVIDRRTGQIRRTVEMGLSYDARVVDDTVYTTYGSTVSAYSADGAEKWRTDVGGSAEIIHGDRERIVVKRNWSVVVLASTTGAVLWWTEGWGKPLAVATDRVLVQHEKSLIWRDLSDGKVLARVGKLRDADWLVYEDSVFVIGRGMVFEAGLDGTISRRTRVPVGKVWASPLNPTRTLLVADSFEDSGPIAAVDTVDLRVRWQLAAARVVAVAPQVVFTHPNHFACGAKLRPVAARDADSGEVLWHLPYCGWAESLAADDTLAVFYGGGDWVTARDPRTGRTIWSIRPAN